jgi:hypothetical protein
MAGNAAGAVIEARGWQVTGSKTTQDGVEAARMCGIDSYPLRLEPQLVCDAEDLDALMNVDALVITLPARRSGPGRIFICRRCRRLSIPRWRTIFRGSSSPAPPRCMATPAAR